LKRIRLAAAALALCLISTPGLAEDFGRSGVYLGASAAYGLGNFYEDAIEDAFPVSVNVDNSWGLNARLGYRLFSFFALEANYEYMNQFDVKVAGFQALEQRTHTITGNLKFLLPLWRFQPYLMLGAGGQYYKFDQTPFGIGDDKDWVFAARPAVGVDFYLTKNLVLNAEGAGVIALDDLKVALGSIDTLPYVSVSAGLQWRF
jgi:opacity protein-like surface antigen